MDKDNMSMEQINEAAAANLEIVDWAMKQYIWSSKVIPDLSYDDLYQVGCLGLIKAVKGYDPHKNVKFSTYAEIVVKNTIIDYSRKVLKREEKMNSSNSAAKGDGRQAAAPVQADSLSLDAAISEKLILELLDSIKEQYTGVTLKGIEAIKFRVMGYSNKDIAELYGVSNNHVGAWISRADQKLKGNKQFISFIKDC